MVLYCLGWRWGAVSSGVRHEWILDTSSRPPVCVDGLNEMSADRRDEGQPQAHVQQRALVLVQVGGGGSVGKRGRTVVKQKEGGGDVCSPETSSLACRPSTLDKHIAVHIA